MNDNPTIPNMDKLIGSVYAIKYFACQLGFNVSIKIIPSSEFAHSISLVVDSPQKVMLPTDRRRCMTPLELCRAIKVCKGNVMRGF